MKSEQLSEIRKIRVTLSIIATLLFLFFLTAIGAFDLIGSGVSSATSSAVDFFMNYRSKEASIAFAVAGALFLILGGAGFFHEDMEAGIRVIAYCVAVAFIFLLLGAVFAPETGWTG